MKKFITVQPVEGRRLPLEAVPTRYVEQEREVPDSPYYRRAIKRGDLKLVTKKTAASIKPSVGKADQK